MDDARRRYRLNMCEAIMSERPNSDWDPRDPTILDDQRLAYDEMRERCPVAYSAFLNWSLFQHNDITNVLADPTTFSSASKHLAVPNGMDPPEHTRYRAALEPFFTPERMQEFEPECRKIAAALNHALPLNREFEFIRAFAHPFALQSQCAFFGWPRESWERLHGWTHGNQDAAFSRDRAAGALLAQEFASYVEEALRIRRDAGAKASDDVTAQLMATTVDGKPLTDEEIVSVMRNWTAGQGTVSAGMEILVLHLAQDSELQAALRSTPALLPNAIDEILRSDGPLVANRRTATREVEIGGRTIGAGDHLTLMWIAANRDPGVFTNPDEISLDRDGSANYLFGSGIHDCLGAPQARLEMRIALEELLAETSTIELGSAETRKRAVYPSNGFQSLPVRLC